MKTMLCFEPYRVTSWPAMMASRCSGVIVGAPATAGIIKSTIVYADTINIVPRTCTAWKGMGAAKDATRSAQALHVV